MWHNLSTSVRSYIVHVTTRTRVRKYPDSPALIFFKTLTDLQILGCELHKNRFGGRFARTRWGGGAIALPKLHSCYKGGEGEKGKKMVGNSREGEDGGREGREWVGRKRKGKRGMKGEGEQGGGRERKGETG